MRTLLAPLFFLTLLLSSCGRKPVYKKSQSVAVKEPQQMLQLPHIPRARYNRATDVLSWHTPKATHKARLSGYAIYRYQKGGFIPPTPFITLSAAKNSCCLSPHCKPDERLAIRPLYEIQQGQLTLVCFEQKRS
ncbi:MAG: hypothetical protein PVJ92_00600 [Candidatus Dependentiae bacterium]|jgi:hypothetical protein